MKTKVNSYTEYNWDIQSNNEMLKKVDNKLYQHLTSVKRMNAEAVYNIKKHITEDVDFMTTWKSLFADMFMQFILLTALPGAGKSTLFLNTELPEHEYLVMVVPTKSICSQIAADMRYNNKVRVINSDIHAYVVKTCQKYVTTAELGGSIVNNIKNIDKDAVIHFVIDEAHEILFDIANFRNGATKTVLETVCELSQENRRNKIFFVTATPEALMNIQYDLKITVKPEIGIQSGVFNICSIRTENARITWAVAQANEIAQVNQQTGGCPVFCLYNNMKKMNAIAEVLRSRGYTVVCIDRTNKTMLNYIEKNQKLPAYVVEYGQSKKVDVILTTSVILSGCNIYPEPCLGDRQFVPCIISEAAKKFNVAEMAQFYTRTRYNVPYITLIKKECKSKGKYDKKSSSIVEIESVISRLLNPVVLGSAKGQGYCLNETISTAESFLDDKETLIENLSFFDSKYNCLVPDLFAVHKCAWDNFNARLYIDSNREALVEAMKEHLCINEVVYELRSYDDACDRMTGEDKEALKAERERSKEERKNTVLALLSMNKCVEKLNVCTKNDTVNAFRLAFRSELSNIQMMAKLGGEEKAVSYIKELVDGSQKSRSAMRHEVVSNALAAPAILHGQQTNTLFLVKSFENADLANTGLPMDLQEQIGMLKKTPEYKQASGCIDTGMTCYEAATQAVESDTLYEEIKRARTRAQLKALAQGVDISKISRFGNEIKIIMDKLVYIKDNSIKSVLGDIFTLTKEHLTGLADCLQDNVSWMHKSAYTAKTVVKILKSMFKVKEYDDNTVLVSIC